MPMCMIHVTAKDLSPLATPGYAIRGGTIDAASLEDGLEIYVEDPTDVDEIDEAVEEALQEMDLHPGDFTWDADAVSAPE